MRRSVYLPRNQLDDVLNRQCYFDDHIGPRTAGTTRWWASTSGLCQVVAGGIGGQMQVYGSASAGTWEWCYHSVMNASAAANTEIRWRAKISSATDIAVQIGLFDSTRANYCAVNIDTASSSNFRFASKATGTSNVDTGITLDTNWHEFRIIMTTASCTFFMDGVPYAPVTTTANITTNLVAPCFGIKTIVSRRYVYSDWLEMFTDRASA